MAIYHCSVSVTSRSSGASSVAAVAYRESIKVKDERLGITHDYQKKSDVVESFTLVPTGSPEWAKDSKRLWNEVEKIERRKDAQLFREVNVALPRELSHDEHKYIVERYCQKNFVDQGMVASVAFHSSKSDNPHAHIMLTMRHINEDGFGKKERSWNDKAQLQEWRKDWSQCVNESLERNHIKETIDHRSLLDQNVTRKPQIHLGRIAHSMEQRGERSERGDQNREIDYSNFKQEQNGQKLEEGIEHAHTHFEEHKRLEVERQKQKKLEQERIKKQEFEKRMKALENRPKTRSRGFGY